MYNTNFMSKEKVTTETTTVAEEPTFFLWEFLDNNKVFNKGSRLYYTKHFGKKQGDKKTASEWTEITSINKVTDAN